MILCSIAIKLPPEILANNFVSSKAVAIFRRSRSSPIDAVYLIRVSYRIFRFMKKSGGDKFLYSTAHLPKGRECPTPPPDGAA